MEACFNSSWPRSLRSSSLTEPIRPLPIRAVDDHDDGVSVGVVRDPRVPQRLLSA
eukprot:CAMPEP_0177746536 /NCGR_PEP_ID=MMETSP0484_2-20121128/30913_1 /TAXON_ID=354590 /ORGANISM="Rhodomonas lens, Strain RHODO" /LENGTH=54 /DNA_ID=CAMNT_0019261275 /DNA_START=227 /DNA_END=391 /DNA_ORIENTATION=+